MDVVSSITRSRMMSGIRGKNTRPEMLVRKALFAQGFRYRLHVRTLSGSPDIVMASRRVAIFVHGCFWHQHADCRFARLPLSRSEFWAAKLMANTTRDQRAVHDLLDRGWRVLTVWECSTRDPGSLASLPTALASWIIGAELLGSLRGPSTLPET